ncbi:MAG: uracil-DNA glycosylase [Pontibacterium sp.]
MALENAPSWQPYLQAEFDAPYMQSLREFLAQEKAAHKVIYPHSSRWFSALETTPLDQVKVVILGQDPYHGDGQAHGLCFSVLPGIKPPPSLVNIYKELEQDVGCTPVSHGYLGTWAEQGVLLLNSVLTVEQAQAASHQGKGWETFTDQVIKVINEQCEGVVFMLWGSYAQKKGRVIDKQKHCVLSSSHPSPLSAYRGFLGCGHFGEANRYLQSQGRAPINWQLPLEPPVLSQP